MCSELLVCYIIIATSNLIWNVYEYARLVVQKRQSFSLKYSSLASYKNEEQIEREYEKVLFLVYN